MRAILAGLLALLALGAPAAAQGDSLTLRDFRADVVVRPDGAVEVTERLRIAFYGPWNGVIRDLSLEHRTAEGRRVKLDVAFSPPTDERGTPLRHEEERDGWTRRLRIWVPGARDAERTLVIRYRVENAVRFFYEGSETGALDELYWNVTGNQWTMPIDRVEARFTLPAGVSPAQVASYTGPAGATGTDAVVRREGNEVVALVERRLHPGEGLTVGVGWAPGVIPRPSERARALSETGRRWPLGIPFAAFFLALRAWRRRGRDPEENAVVVGYEPPAGMSPAELGTLIDHRVDMRDLTATLVDLAVRGYLGIEETEEKKVLGLFSSTDYVFHLRRPREEWTALPDHEQRFLNALFSGAHAAGPSWELVKAAMAEARRVHDAGEKIDGAEITRRLMAEQSTPLDSVRLSQLQNVFYTSIPGIKDAVYEALMKRGYYRDRPDRVKARWIGGGVLLLVAGIAGGVAATAAAPGWVDGLSLGLGVGLSGLIVLLFGGAMPARTTEGARAREHALGFREFLDKVESDRFRRMITSPELFERFLPHAMAFGVEAHWAAAFDDLLSEPPDWYSGGRPGGFRPSAFTSSLGDLSSRAGSTLASSTSSSGSGGGGSSGGGSGGGGGSGF